MGIKTIAALFILSLVFVNISSAMETPADFHIKGTIANWVYPIDTKTAIDKLVSIGGNAMSVNSVTESYINCIRDNVNCVNNNRKDYIKDAIVYADKKDVKFIISMSMTVYSSDREDFRTDIDAQNRFANDVEWVLKTYPTVDGIMLEEAQTYIPANGLLWQPFTNAYFTRLNTIVKKYHVLNKPSDFEFSFNVASNNDGSIASIGIDVPYIRDNNLFNAYMIQSGYDSSVNTTIGQVRDWRVRFPNFVIIHSTTLTSSGLTNPCNAKYGKDNWGYPECWNQGVFQQIKYDYTNNVPTRIFTHGRLGQSRTLWPTETIPGANGFDKVKYIWTGGVNPKPTVTATPKPTIRITIVPPVIPSASGSMSVSSNPPQAKIIVNNQPAGVTNRTGDNKIEMLAVPFYIQIVKNGYKTITDYGIVVPGKTIQKTYTMQPITQKTWFKAWVDEIVGLN